MMINKYEFIKCMREAGILVDEEQLFNESYSDSLLLDLANLVIKEGEYLGAGIGRCAFKFYKWVIKISRDFVNYEPDEWSDKFFDTYNELDRASKTPYQEAEEGMHQTYREVFFYKDAYDNDSLALEDIFEVYACSSNYVIELAEYCETVEEELVEGSSEHMERYEYLNRHYDDVHEGNVGINSLGELVVIDLGWM